jgi:hypothetical protein
VTIFAVLLPLAGIEVVMLLVRTPTERVYRVERVGAEKRMRRCVADKDEEMTLLSIHCERMSELANGSKSSQKLGTSLLEMT